MDKTNIAWDRTGTPLTSSLELAGFHKRAQAPKVLARKGDQMSVMENALQFQVRHVFDGIFVECL